MQRWGRAGSARGRASESLAKQALEILKQAGCIRDFQMTGRMSTLDRQGVDAVLVTRDGVALSLQVKSGIMRMMAHLARYPDIKCILVDPKHQQPQDVAKGLQYLFDLPPLPLDDKAPK